MIATFDIETAKKANMYRAAKLAVLTHQALTHIDLADAAALECERAVAELIEATHEPAADTRRSAFLHLKAGQTLGM